MIELFEQNERKSERQSSKGNQLKWENEGIWYKADYTGYEGLAEYMISHLLVKSTLNEAEYALYDLEEIKYKSIVYRGVKSKSFLAPGWQIITLERLFKQFTGESLYKTIVRIPDKNGRVLYLAAQIERITKLPDFGGYLNKLFTIDAFFLNEDRHMHNIAVLMNEEGEFMYCPIFDNGAALLADTTMDYALDGDVYELMGQVQAKTISSCFDEQLDVSEENYGMNLKFTFSKKDVKELLDGAAIYTDEEKSRVEEIIYAQMRKYSYLW